MPQDDTLAASDASAQEEKLPAVGPRHRSLFYARAGFERPTPEQLVECTAEKVIAGLVTSLRDEPERFWKVAVVCASDAIQQGRPKTALKWSGTEKQIRDFIGEAETEFRSEAFRSALTTILTKRAHGEQTPFHTLMPSEASPLSDRAKSVLRDITEMDLSAAAGPTGLPEDVEPLLDAIRDQFGRESDDERAASLAAGLSDKGRSQPDDSAFVAAKTLYEHRGMTAAKCNKFLKRFGSESAEPIEGKIRNRSRGKNRREIHSGDWLKFWQDVDRRRSDALDEDAMQEFLANAEAEKAKVKSARKLGRTSFR